MDAALNEEAVENLVTQFSSSLDFYRELVQNSIDAGSSAVDVWMEYEPGDGVEGVITIHIDDFGEGMNEEIIDQQLTKLFSSTKENDLTKIGKFGIGFVSVFALRPQGVLVQTGRGGECWEVFFHADRSFVKGRLDVPVEGTQISLFLEGGRARYRELVEGSRATLAKWCAHSDTEISFEDRSPSDADAGGVESINRPFEVDGDCRAHVVHPGSELSVGFSLGPVYGFYNKGLALAVTSAGNDILEGRAARFRHIAFKIKSRYLEHTLSRETVMRDENYEKAMALLEAAVAGPLRETLLAELEAVCGEASWSLAEMTRYQALIGYLASEPGRTLGGLGARAVLRGVSGGAFTLAQAEGALEQDGRVLVAEAPSKLTHALSRGGTPVFLGAAARTAEGGLDPVSTVLVGYLAARARANPVGWVKDRLFGTLEEDLAARVVHPESVLVSVAPAASVSSVHQALLTDAYEVLRRTGLGYTAIVGGSIEGRPESPRLFAMGRQLSEVMALPPRGIYRRKRFERPCVLVNLRHPYFTQVQTLYRSHRAMGAYCLAKAMLLEEDRKLHRDGDLMQAAKEEAL